MCFALAEVDFRSSQLVERWGKVITRSLSICSHPLLRRMGIYQAFGKNLDVNIEDYVIARLLVNLNIRHKTRFLKLPKDGMQ